MENFPKR